MKSILVFALSLFSFSAFAQDTVRVRFAKPDTGRGPRQLVTGFSLNKVRDSIAALGGSGTVSSFGANDLAPLFTTTEANPTTTPVLSFSLTNASPYTVFGRGASSGAPFYLAFLDSNWIPSLHGESYYNTRYKPIGATSGTDTADRAGYGFTIGRAATYRTFTLDTGTVFPAVRATIASGGGGGGGTEWARVGGLVKTYYTTDTVAIGTASANGKRLYVNGTTEFNGNITFKNGTQFFNPAMGGFFYNDNSGTYLSGSNAIEINAIGNYLALNANGAAVFSNATGAASVAGAQVAINTTSKTFLPPRMTKAQRDAIAVVPTGGVIFQTDNTPGIRIYNGTNWMKFTETAD